MKKILAFLFIAGLILAMIYSCSTSRKTEKTTLNESVSTNTDSIAIKKNIISANIDSVVKRVTTDFNTLKNVDSSKIVTDETIVTTYKIIKTESGDYIGIPEKQTTQRHTSENRNIKSDQQNQSSSVDSTSKKTTDKRITTDSVSKSNSSKSDLQITKKKADVKSHSLPFLWIYLVIIVILIPLLFRYRFKILKVICSLFKK
jgi:Flp pilus assembly protein TadB